MDLDVGAVVRMPFATLGVLNLDEARNLDRISLHGRSKLLTEKPDTGDLPVRFGGRGGVRRAVPAPIPPRHCTPSSAARWAISTSSTRMLHPVVPKER